MRPFLAKMLLLALTAVSILRAHAQGGVPLWTNLHGPPGYNLLGPAFAVDRTGNVFTVSPGTGEYEVIAFSSLGTPLWTNSWGTDASPCAIAVDKVGTVFVTGECNTNYATIGFSSAGTLLWTNTYSNPCANARKAFITVFTNGTAFVTSAEGDLMSFAVCGYGTRAFANDGSPLWSNLYPSGTPAAIVNDTTGNVLVAGVSYSIPYGTGNNFVTVAYSVNGTPLWETRYSGHDSGSGADGQDIATAMAVDGSGNVFVTGGSSLCPRCYANYHFATVAYSNTGLPLWTNRYDAPSSAADGAFAHAIGVDQIGNVFVTGNSWLSSSNSAYATVAYSGAGLPLWTNLYQGAARGQDGATALAVDNKGNVIVSGYSQSTTNKTDIATIAYSGTGVPLWTNRYEAGDTIFTTTVAVDANGEVLVSGPSRDGSAIIKYSAIISPTQISIVSDAANGFFLRAQGPPNFTCRLQRATTINGPWATSAPQTADASGLVEFHDLFSPFGQAFYRTVQ